MITSKCMQTLLLAATAGLLSTAAAAAPVRCEGDDACVRTVIAETVVFVDECAKAYPKSKADLETALTKWTVLKLKIPNIEEALEPKSTLRATLKEAVTPYFKKIPDFERELECAGRLEMLRSAEPKLQGDFARIPNGVLRKYARR